MPFWVIIALIVPNKDLLGCYQRHILMGEGFRQRFIDPFDIGRDRAREQLIDTVHPTGPHSKKEDQ